MFENVSSGKLNVETPLESMEGEQAEKALVPPEPQPESASAVQKKRRKRKKNKGAKTDTVAPGSNGNASREKPKAHAKPSKSPYVTSLESQYPISLQVNTNKRILYMY